MKRIGIVEGYYGKIPTFEQRKKIITSLSEHGLNFYMYAPKEDPFLRSNIDIDHTENWLREFDDFIAYSQKMSVEVSIGLAPIYKNKTNQPIIKIKNILSYEKYFNHCIYFLKFYFNCSNGLNCRNSYRKGKFF